MIQLTEKVCLDLSKARFDLSLEEAFGLTEVRSVEDYERLLRSLPEIKGQYYFFVNVLQGKARLMVTVVVAEKETVTKSHPLDLESVGLTREDIILTVGPDPSDGNYPIPPEVKVKIKVALEKDFSQSAEAKRIF